MRANEETIAHELGHELGLPHTFCHSKNQIDPECPGLVGNPGRDILQGKTKANFMDYRDGKNMFFIYQILNIKP